MRVWSTRRHHESLTHLRDFPNLETYAGAYNAGGQVEVQNRARRLTDPDLLAEYGDGYYPLRWVYDKGDPDALMSCCTCASFVEPSTG